MTKLQTLALAVALAPATAFAFVPGPDVSITAGIGMLDGRGNPVAHLPIATPPSAHIDTETDDTAWSASLAWHINDHWAIEAWTATAAERSAEIDVENSADVPLARFSTAPITATVHYRLGGLGRVTPFAGLGLHWTRVNDVEANASYDSLAGMHLSNDSGLAAVAGVDIALDHGWFARADARWMDTATDRTTFNSAKQTLDIDSTYYELAIGYRF